MMKSRQLMPIVCITSSGKPTYVSYVQSTISCKVRCSRIMQTRNTGKAISITAYSKTTNVMMPSPSSKNNKIYALFCAKDATEPSSKSTSSFLLFIKILYHNLLI